MDMISAAMGAERNVWATCDRCGYDFRMCIKTSGRDRFRCTYFQCPECLAYYPVVAVDERMEPMMCAFISSFAGAEDAAIRRRVARDVLSNRSDIIFKEHPVEWFLGQEEEDEL